MQPIKYRAISYLRLSITDGNPGESDSIANQRKLIDEYLKKHPEIEAVSEKVDDGWSGILFDRPAFGEMMQDIEEGKINCCIVKDLSRLGREYIETGRYLRRIFPSYGVRFIAINDNIDTLNDSGDDLAISLKSIINDAYCRDISIKTRSALSAKRGNGDYVGSCPIYGYRKSEENHNRLVTDEYPAGIVRDIFRMKIDGLSALRIANTLNDLGVLSPYQYKKDRGLPHPKKGYADKDDAKWSATTVIRILQDETYAGTLIQGKCGTPNYKLREVRQKPEDEWHRIENAHEAIIEKHLFGLVQKIMRLDARTAPHNDRLHTFSGLLICGCCGSRMKRKTILHKSKKYYYYWCPTTKKRGCSNPALLKEDDLMQCVLYILKSHIESVVSLDSLIASLDADHMAHELNGRLSAQIAENEHGLEKIRKFKAGLYESMVNGLLSKEEYKSLKDRYSTDADILIAANERLQNEIDTAMSCEHEQMAWMRHLTEFASIDAIDRRTVVSLIRSIRVLGKNNIEIEFTYQSEYDTALALMESCEMPQGFEASSEIQSTALAEVV